MKIFLLIIALSFPVFADVELSLGHGKSRHPSNGVWWQDPFPHKIDNSDTVYSLGYRWDNGWGAGYKDLGEYSSWALASASDHNYDGYQAGTEDIWPLSTWIGEGSVKGIYVNRKFQYRYVYLLAGAWYHDTKWKMHIPDWRAALGGPDRLGASFTGPRPLTVHSNQKAVSWMLGIGAEIENLGILYEVIYIDGGREYKPMYSGPAQVVSMTYRF